MSEYNDGSKAFRLKGLRNSDIDVMFSVQSSSKKDDLDVDVLEKVSFEGEPLETPSFSHGNFQLVGHGLRTSPKCGTFFSFWGCPRSDLHNLITVDGENHKGKNYIKKVFHSCDKPSCPVCYKWGWCVREARKIEARLKEASKRFGQVEHISATVPPKFYSLDYDALRVKIKEVLFRRGVIGGAMIFHGFRYNLRKYWYWSPHFHVLGFILGGYPCRRCVKVQETGKCGIENKGCDGFVNRQYRAYEKDGCIVTVEGERVTVGGTAWYILNHSSVDVSKKRFRVATWFGVASYRKLKVTPEVKKSVCPVCKHELVKLRYFGNRKEILSCWGSNRCDHDKCDSFEDAQEDGQDVWVEDVKREWGSGSYGEE